MESILALAGVAMVIFSILAPYMYNTMVDGVRKKKASGRQQQTKEARAQYILSVSLQHMPPPIPGRSRERAYYPLSVQKSLLSEAWAAGPQGVLHELLRIDPTSHNKRDVQFWVAMAIEKPHSVLRAGAFTLLSHIEQVLMDDAKNSGWAGIILPHPLLYPLQEPLQQGGQPLKAVCMPFDNAKLHGPQKPKYLSVVGGYLWVDFGKGTYGLGRGGLKEHKQVKLTVSHVVCWLFNGPPPSSNHVCSHLCGYLNCLNPYHLGWATRLEDAMMKGWHKDHRGFVPNEWKKHGMC